MTLYQITDDLLTINNLLESCVDEEGNPREPTEEELEIMRNDFVLSNQNFETKTENICKFIKNLSVEAENVEAERKSYKAEMDRLSKRAKAYQNKAECVKSVLRYAMERLGTKKIKTTLFSAGIQNTQMKVEPTSTIDYALIPDKYKKVVYELDKEAIKKDLKEGILFQKSGPDNYSKVFNSDGQVFGISAVQGSSLVIR